MGRDFNGTTDMGLVSQQSSINDLSTLTICSWIRPDSIGENTGRLLHRGNAGADRKLINLFATNCLRFIVARASVTADAQGNTGLTYGNWYFVACTYDETDGPRIYIASPGGSIAESGYTSRAVGSGSTTSDSTHQPVIGNRNQASGDRSWDGVIAEHMWFNSILSLEEMRIVMNGYPTRLGSGLKMWLRFMTPGSSEHDWSGNGNTCSMTGTVLAPHPPGYQFWNPSHVILPAPGGGGGGGVPAPNSFAMMGAGV
jgi:hypothetical protein